MALIVSGSVAGYLVFTHGVLLGDLAVVLGQDGARDGEGEGDEQHPGTEGGDTAPASFRSPDTSPHFTHNFSRFLNVKFQDQQTINLCKGREKCTSDVSYRVHDTYVRCEGSQIVACQKNASPLFLIESSVLSIFSLEFFFI